MSTGYPMQAGGAVAAPRTPARGHGPRLTGRRPRSAGSAGCPTSAWRSLLMAAVTVGLTIAPLAEAVAKLDARTPIGAALRSDQWAEVPLALRERAQFSAHVESVRLLAAIQEKLRTRLALAREQVAHGEALVDRSSFIADIRAIAETEGVRTTDAAGAGTVRDIRSSARLGLIFDQQTRQAAGFADWKSGQDGDVLDAFPAQELIRVEARQVPRDWPSRWLAAGGRFFGGRMIALKSDPVWERISRFGTPWPPFDYASGMGVRDVDRAEAEALGLLKPGQAAAPAAKQFNDGLEASASGWRPEQVSTLKLAFGDQVVERDGRLRWQGNLIGDLARGIREAGLDSFNASAWKGRSINFGAATPQAVQEAAKVGKRDGTSFELAGHRMILDPLHVHHILADHPEMTVADLETIPHVWRAPDTIRRGGNDRSLLMFKRLLNRTVLVGFDLNPQERVWQASSARVEKG